MLANPRRPGRLRGHLVVPVDRRQTRPRSPRCVGRTVHHRAVATTGSRPDLIKHPVPIPCHQPPDDSGGPSACPPTEPVLIQGEQLRAADPGRVYTFHTRETRTGPGALCTPGTAVFSRPSGCPWPPPAASQRPVPATPVPLPNPGCRSDEASARVSC